MKPKELCEKFIAADNIINGEIENNLTHRPIINDPKFKEYCPNSNCETNMQINGFGEYLFNKLGKEIENEYYEYFMIWLSDKLFKIAKEDDESQIGDITLNSAYEKYLKKNIKKGIYWSLLDIKQGLKQVNLMHMKQFYKLLNNICNAIVYYNSSRDDTEKFINYSTECYNQYLSLYNSVPKCDSYLHLLDNLKKTYEGFKNSVHDEIKNKYQDLAMNLKTLTIENANPYFVKNFKEFDFNRSECKPQKAKTGEVSHQNGSEDPKSGKMSLGSGKGITDGGGEKGDPDHGKRGTNNVSGSTGGGSGSGASGRQVGTDSGTGSGKGGTKVESGPPGSGQGAVTGGPDSGTSSVQSDQGGSVDRSKALGDPIPPHSSGTSYIYWSSNWRMSLNLTGYMPSASSIYESSKNILTSATNQITSTYNSAKAIAQDTYDSAVTAVKNTYDNAMTTIKGAYSATTNYIDGTVSIIINQFNSLFFFSQLSDDQSGSRSSGNSLPTGNNPPSTTQPPKSDTNPLTPPSSSQTPSQSSSNQAQDSSKDPSSQKQPSSTHNSQDTLQNGASNIVQQTDPNDGKGGIKTMTITQVTLLSSSTGPSSIGNGNTTGTVVKTNEKSSIWYIAQNKKYDILGIGIISISIFAFLAIMYKYLSLGCTSKSKRKKSMKKVINSIGGKRPIQIIIKSYDRNKDLKPVINSVDRKKDPLINIYKLMQADPIPFINLFFLLIFFVYKRQLNYLEL
ncbi:PIR protein CIR protein [Plasmodium vinckei brucechwatti]|uniref:PIR protein CIR protein n=1 Tax=Plasmodium vinckei brucechwatti TaxID=119398 RepID=A0A6V7S6V4_PLAVN|nr:PIR protein CIR protein [Plasmodium vinckei brucechwatti]